MRRKISWDGRKDRQTEGRTEVKQHTPSGGAGYNKTAMRLVKTLPQHMDCPLPTNNTHIIMSKK